jgi:hypothetical protein
LVILQISVHPPIRCNVKQDFWTIERPDIGRKPPDPTTLKGYHLTNARLPEATKRRIGACQDSFGAKFLLLHWNAPAKWHIAMSGWLNRVAP